MEMDITRAPTEDEGDAAATMTTMTVGLASLPPEVWECIFSFLSARDLVRASLACSQFSATASENKLWRDLYCHVFDISLHQCLPSIAAPPHALKPTTASAGGAEPDLQQQHGVQSSPSTAAQVQPDSGGGGADGGDAHEEVVLISNVKLRFSDATHVSVAREQRDWRGLFAVRYEVEKRHCISFLQREREQIKRRKLERSAARGKTASGAGPHDVVPLILRVRMCLDLTRCVVCVWACACVVGAKGQQHDGRHGEGVLGRPHDEEADDRHQAHDGGAQVHRLG
jgi:hypothetical protein